MPGRTPTASPARRRSGSTRRLIGLQGGLEAQAQRRRGPRWPSPRAKDPEGQRSAGRTRTRHAEHAAPVRGPGAPRQPAFRLPAGALTRTSASTAATRPAPSTVRPKSRQRRPAARRGPRARGRIRVPEGAVSGRAPFNRRLGWPPPGRSPPGARPGARSGSTPGPSGWPSPSRPRGPAPPPGAPPRANAPAGPDQL